jgi:signal transduction histidine kinase
VVIERQLEEPFPKIRTDLAKLHQILYLLLDNAAKFTPKGRIGIHARVAGGELCCEIRDTGIGIAPDDREAVFDEFYQVDDATSTRYRGAGLGLALVRDLVTLLDGSLQLDSEIGEGTTVTVTFPVHVVG